MTNHMYSMSLIPPKQADLYVPEGTTHTVKGRENHRLIRVEGTLRIADGAHLTTHTLLATPRSTVKAHGRWRITITDGAFLENDPKQFSRGLVLHGTTEFSGHPKSSFVRVEDAAAGDTVLTLRETPRGWNPGDVVVLTGAQYGQSERRRIASVEGTTVHLREPLSFPHRTPRADLSHYLANLSRSARIESESIRDRGHVMFMHNPSVTLEYVRFAELGRTDKGEPVTDPKLDEDGQLIEGTAANPRARYAVHFHRTGTAEGARAARVEGIAVDNGPGWGVVNHSSYVRVSNSVSYDVDGAGFVAEAGNEIGSFVHNLAIRSRGSGEGFVDSREYTGSDDPKKVDDFGHNGHGFFLQSPLVRVQGNVASGHRSAAFVWWTRGLFEEPIYGSSIGARVSTTNSIPNVAVENVPDRPELTQGRELVQSEDLHLREVSGNTAFASAAGMDLSRHMPTVPSVPSRSVVEGFTAWGLGGFQGDRGAALNGVDASDRGVGGTGMVVRLSKHLVLRNARLIGTKAHPASHDAYQSGEETDAEAESVGIRLAETSRDVVLENNTITGFSTATVGGGPANEPSARTDTPLVKIPAVHPSETNPGYWEYRGETTLLVGAGDEDRLFQFTDEALVEHLEELDMVGVNYLRNAMGDQNLEVLDPEDRGQYATEQLRGRYDPVYPYESIGSRAEVLGVDETWATKDPIYDLNRFNPEYWRRLERFLRETAKRDMIVHLDVWDAYSLTQEMWRSHPWHPNNNVNYRGHWTEPGTEKRTILHWNVSYGNVHRHYNQFFQTVPKLRDDPLVLHFQKRYVAKMLSITDDYPHVIYNINRDAIFFSGFSKDGTAKFRDDSQGQHWARFWARFIQEHTDRDVAITDQRRSCSRSNRALVNDPDLYDYIDYSACSTVDHFESRLAEQTQRFDAPVNVVALEDTGSQAVKMFWYAVMSGAAAVRYDEPPEGTGYYAGAVNSLRGLAHFRDRFPITEAKPANLFKGSPAIALRETSGEIPRYAVFWPWNGWMWDNRRVLEMDLDEYPRQHDIGTLDVTWINVESGRVLEGRTIKPTWRTTVSPPAEGLWVSIFEPVRN